MRITKTSSAQPIPDRPLYKSVEPDILLLDLNMPILDGFGVMDQLGAQLSSVCPVLVLTADARSEAKHKALSCGASDFLTKPFDEVEVLLRIRNLLSTHFYSTHLEELVVERTKDLERAQLETIQRLALAAEYRDDATGMHTRRVGKLSQAIAIQMGLPTETVELIGLAAPLHDVGKIALPDAILLKPDRLTEEEFAEVKQHTTIGARILSGSGSPLLKVAEEIAMYHHERWDGRGYLGLKAEDIPLIGRIVCVADVFDALTHVRPYKRAWSAEDAIAEITRHSGTQFDPAVVKAFLQVLAGIRASEEG